jgi:ATP-binding cassette, subfamily C (CFTR/MRP), member 1
MLYALTGNALRSEVIFPAIGLFTLLKFPLLLIPAGLGALIESLVSMGRLEEYFALPEREEDPEFINDDQKIPVRLKKATFEWDTIEASDFQVKDVTIDIKKGSLVCIVGDVASGKSTLLKGLLSESKKVSGEVKITGDISYCSQKSWIKSDTVFNNILFGKKYNQEKYKKILKVCQLERDLIEIGGDETEIGENGVTVSGGQKQRINIARSCYYSDDCDIFVLDDPLSAVDAEVGSQLFEQCFNGYLKDKTRIWVTNQFQYLKYADQIIVLDRGVVSAQGTFDEIIQGGGKWKEFLKKGDEVNKDDVKEEKEPLVISEVSSSIFEAEERSTGFVKWNVIATYFKNMNIFLVIFCLCYFIHSQLGLISSDFWIAVWFAGLFPDNTVQFNVAVYAIISFGTSFALFIREAVFNIGGLLSSTRIHNNAFGHLMKAPLNWFTTNPLGRILSRFSKDQQNLDSFLIFSFTASFAYFFSLVGITSIIYIANPWSFILLIPVSIIMILIIYSRATSNREIRRLDSMNKSPLYAHFRETLTGVSTISAFHQQENFMKQNMKFIDNSQRTFNMLNALKFWGAIRIQLVGSVYSFIILGMMVVDRKNISEGIMGLGLAYALQLPLMYHWLAAELVDAESNLNYVERMVYYTYDVPEEGRRDIPDKQPPKWPTRGNVIFDNYTLKYRKDKDEIALRSLSIEIKPQEKIGVVGRSGAGKSSLAAALWRIVEAHKGKIIIDDIDISTLGLKYLRSNLSIILQEPTLFTGTIRSNLDLTNIYSDEEIWEALDKSCLKDTVLKLPGKLEFEVEEGGKNFSSGESQLLCLSRALLRKSKILIMDEATASLDPKTDSLVQKIVQSEFKDCTVITIAHRIDTVLNSDRILVLDKGIVAEFDSPTNLKNDEKSIFFQLLTKSKNH